MNKSEGRPALDENRQMRTDAPFPIVGIGASAGGLRALEDFFKTIPAQPGMAFVVVTHLAPDRESFLTDILARHTDLPVHVACDGQKVEQDAVYVLPPNASMTIAGGLLRLRQTEPGEHERNPIDVFFASLAEDCGEYSVGMVLSGSGHDGVLGVKAIKELGGLVLAQSSGGSGPGFADMPDSAIASGLVDFAVPVEAMAPLLEENARGFTQIDRLAGARPSGDQHEVENEECGQIYAILRAQTGHDFSGYKTRTFLRRVQRRMQVHHCEALADYVGLLQRQPDEAPALFRDLLINVTSFFRDQEAFETLTTLVIPRLFEGRGAADTVRVWAPGCSTGEEVISIAILMREHLDTLRAAPRVTIFATDIDEHALAVARAGRYPAALLEGVSPERRRRFFAAQAGNFVVAKEVRDLCVFSPHNVLRDPPFSRMDLISCRNLLIYFGAEAQRQVLPIFHYALRPGGFLFLGKSETVGRFSELFSALDKTNCVFQALDTGSPARMPIFVNGLHPAPFAARLSEAPVSGGGAPLRLAVEARVADRFGPPHVVVNEEGDIVHYSSRTGKYLEAPYGTPTRQLLTIARKELRLDLRAALRAAIESRRAVTRDDVAFEPADHRVERVSLTVEPLADRHDGHRLYLVVFEEKGQMTEREAGSASESDRSGDGDRTSQAEIELRETRERLQGTIEEYETALEELKSANEELVSLNEEMQSSNEELESTKEELQSLNEELQTVNHELSAKIEELDRANGDLTNLLASTNVATIFLDRNLVIRSFTPAVTQLFNVIATDRGRPLGDLAIKLDYPELQADIASVLASGEPIERRAHQDLADAPYFLARLTPYRDSTGAVDGVVATFVDVTRLARSEEQQRSLVSELNHRVKNTVNVILAIAQQTLARAATPDEFSKSFFARLNAMARSHELLSRENWGEVNIEQVVQQALTSYVPNGSGRVSVSGPATMLPPALALSLGVVINELATNAVKYGALSNGSGRVAIGWSASKGDRDEASALTLTWRESGGPPVIPPTVTGFGVKVIKREVEYSHSGAARFDFAEGGLTVRLELPLKGAKETPP
jgi:two-component system, chemotaxis family, CheB/CheR fusion protein